MLEEHRCRSIHQWSTKTLAASNDIDEATLVERLEHTTDCNTTNLLDLGSTDRLTIRDDGERLESSRGKSLGTRRELGALDRLGVFGASQDLPSTSNLLQLDTVSVDVIMLTQFVDGGSKRCRRIIR